MARVPDSNARGRGKKADEPKFKQIKLISPPLRMSYPKIFDPEKNDQGVDVWEIDGLIPPDCHYAKNHPDYPGKHFADVLFGALEEVMLDAFGPEDEWPNGRNDSHPGHKIKRVTKSPGPGIDDKWEVFKARSYSQPGIVDADKNEVLSKREAYGGRWCRLSVTVTCFDNKSKGCTIYLNNVQLLDNDESFGGRPSAENDFDAYDGPRQGSDDGRRSRDRDDDRGRGRGGREADERSRDDGAGGRDRSSRDEDSGRGRDRDRSDDRGGSRGGDRGASRGRGADDEHDAGGERGGGFARGTDRGRDREEARGREERSGRGRDDDREPRGSSRDDGARRGRDEGSSSRDSGRPSRTDDRDPPRGRRDEAERDGGRDRGSRGERDERDRSSSRSSDEGEGRPSDRGRERDRDDRDDERWN